jgi:type I restriction enzyme M protein
MTDTKKEQEREELHRAIWAIADELRGAVYGWDFKNYVLGTMFYRYISENITNYINTGEQDAGTIGFDYAKMSDDEAEEAREGLVEEKGFFILPSELFCNVTANSDNDENLNETLERVFHNIEASAKGSSSESDFAGLFDDYDVNSNKLGATVAKRNERLSKLLHGVANMNLGDVKDHDIDTFAARAEEKHFSHLASYEEIAGNDYNLSVSTYVEAEDTREKIDIVKLNAEIKEIVAREQVLRDEIDKIIAEIER